MESDRYKLTVLFLKTFFRSCALSVKLHTHKKTQRETVSSMLSTTGRFNEPYIKALTKHHWS